MVVSMAACGSTNSDADKSTTGSAAEESQNAGKDTLVMATNATFPPYEYVDGRNTKESILKSHRRSLMILV